MPRGERPDLQLVEQLVFRGVAKAEPWDETLEIANSGPVEVPLSRAYVEGVNAEAFAFSSAPRDTTCDESLRACNFDGATLPVSSTQRWKIRFKPNQVGQHAAELVIRGADAWESTWRVALVGECVEGACTVPVALGKPKEDEEAEWVPWDDPQAPLTLVGPGWVELGAMGPGAPWGGRERYWWSAALSPPGSYVGFLPGQDYKETDAGLLLAGDYQLQLARIDEQGLQACQAANVWAEVIPFQAGLYVELAWDNEELAREGLEGRLWMPLSLHLRRPGVGWGDPHGDCATARYRDCYGWGGDSADPAQTPDVVYDSNSFPSPKIWWLEEPRAEPEPGAGGEEGWVYGVAVSRLAAGLHVPGLFERTPARSSVGTFRVNLWADGEPVTTIGPLPIPEAGMLCPVARVPWPLTEVEVLEGCFESP